MTAKEQNLPRWDLSDLYSAPTDKKLAADIALLREYAHNFKTKYEGHVENLNGDELGQAIADYEEIIELSTKIGT
jgi:oligoendopeptidase F